MLRESRKKNTKELIVRNAVQLFKEKGYDNVTVEEITQICGIAKGTFFNYFHKKENVLLHLADTYTERMSGIVHKHRKGHLKDRLIRIFSEYLHIYLQHADLLRLTLLESIKSAMESNDASTNLALFQQSIRGMLEEAKENGLLRSPIDSSVSASVLAAIFYHTLINWSASADEEKIVAILRQQLDAVWEGIAGAETQKNNKE